MNALILKPQNTEHPITLDALKTLEIAPLDSSIVARNELIAQSKEIEQVTGDKSNEVAIGYRRQLRELVDSTEATRKEIKAPVDALAKKIQAASAGFITPLEEEIRRLGSLINGWATKQRIAAEKATAEEAARLAKIEADKAALAAQQASATTVAEVQELRKQEQQLAKAQAAPVAIRQAVKVEGTKTKVVWKYDVTDVLELVKARPDLCDITPSKLRINEALKGGMKTCPGIQNIRQEVEVLG